MEGQGKALMDGVWHPLKPGDVVFMPPNVAHQYANAREASFKFLCGIAVKKLR